MILKYVIADELKQITHIHLVANASESFISASASSIPLLVVCYCEYLEFPELQLPHCTLQLSRTVILAITKHSIMVFNTITVGTAVTPTVIETYFSHVRTEPPPKTGSRSHNERSTSIENHFAKSPQLMYLTMRVLI